MPADTAAANGEYFTTDPFERRGSGGVPHTADLRNRLMVSRRYVVCSSRISTGIVTSSRSLDRHRIKLRQVNLIFSVFLYNIIF